MRVFVDTSSLLALSRSRDQYHELAVGIARRHLGAGGRFVGTTLILGELYSHLLYLRGPADARTALSRLLDDPAHHWMEVSEVLIRNALDGWLTRFADQRLSLVDAVSFEVMRDERITHAFAFDHHFELAGYHLMS